MKCPFCNTINRDDRTVCYHCNGDLTVLRTVILKSKQHYNKGLEYAERGKLDEAVGELKTAVSIYNDFAQAHNVLGTLYAKQEKWEQAIAQWQQTLNLDPTNKKASEYLQKAKQELEEPILYREARLSKIITIVLAIILGIVLIWHFRINTLDNRLESAEESMQEGKYVEAYKYVDSVVNNKVSYIHKHEALRMRNELNEIRDTKIKEIKSLISQGKYDAGLQIISKLRQAGIPQSWEKPVSQIEDSVYSVITQNALSSADSTYQEKGDYQTARNIIESAKSKIRNKKYISELDKKLSSMQNDWFGKTYAVAEENYQKKEYEKANEKINELKVENLSPDLLSKVNNLGKEVQKEINAKLLSSAKQLISKKKYEDFLKTANQIDLAYLTDADKQWLNQQMSIAKSPPKRTSKKTGKK